MRPDGRMNGTLTLLNLAGYVALLLWGVHMVSTGVMRAFGADLRRVLGRSLRYRLNAFLVGLGVTAALQSSTATGLIATSLRRVRRDRRWLPALAVMLGANVGTTLIVQLAVLRHLAGRADPDPGRRRRLQARPYLHRATSAGSGSASGLILLALHLLVVAIEPAAQVPAVRAVFGLVASAPALGLLIAAGLAWAAHSSVAIVLLVMSLAGAGVIEPAAAVALVLGANLGSAINPVLEGRRQRQPGQPPAAGRQPR